MPRAISKISANLVNRFWAAFGWRWDKISIRARGHFVRKGGATYIRWRWPWPLRKPYQRASLRLYSLGGGVGDELMCTPIFREIRRLNPKCHITFLSRHPELFQSNPHVDAVEPFSQKGGRSVFQIAYLAVLPPPRPLITLMAECVGLELRTDHLEPPTANPSDAVRERMTRIPAPRIVIQPLASQWTPNKMWPIASWVTLIEKLTTRFDVIEVGTHPLFAGHDFGPRFHTFAGTTTLSDFVWIISQGTALVAPPSGGMHIANAFKIPSFIIFGGYESPAGYYYPLAGAFYSGVQCAPCWTTVPCPFELKCLRMISPEKVFRAICRTVTPHSVE